MNKKKYQLYSALGLLVAVSLIGISLTVSAFSGNMTVENFYEAETPVEEAVIGSITGPDVYGDFRVHGRFLQGGTMLATSTTQAAVTVPASDLVTYSGYDFTPGNLAVTLTLPATTTIVGFLNAGECTDWRIRNLDTSSATSTTIAAGVGIDLMENENGDVVIEGGNEARITFCRENTDTDITAYVDEYIAAD